MWGSHVDMGWGWWMAGSVMMFLFWGIIVWVLLSLARSGISRPSRTDAESAREIADRRLASGEIDPEEHERIIEQLARSRGQ